MGDGRQHGSPSDSSQDNPDRRIGGLEGKNESGLLTGIAGAYILPEASEASCRYVSPLRAGQAPPLPRVTQDEFGQFLLTKLE